MVEIVGVVIAGGLSRRMGGGDKGLRLLDGRPLLAWVADRAAPQVDRLFLNANDDTERFAALGLPILPDGLPGRPGPLAGLLAALEGFPDADWVATFPSDAPFLPGDLVSRLKRAALAEGRDAACAASGGRLHAVFGLWRPGLAGPLRRAVMEEGLRRAGEWAERAGAVRVDFPDRPFDPFFNLNRPEDLAEAERMASVLAQAGQ
ncbi:MAG: molybdenum cofactor guanylyltransferase MobA [Magnetospirillum sp. WYHS-4]